MVLVCLYSNAVYGSVNSLYSYWSTVLYRVVIIGLYSSRCVVLYSRYVIVLCLYRYVYMSLYSGSYRERRSGVFASGEFSRPLYNIYHFGIFRSISQKSLGVYKNMNLNRTISFTPTELKVIYKKLTDARLTENERRLMSHIAMKVAIEGKVRV